MSTEKSRTSKSPTRRKFLLAAGATGAATIAMPQVSRAQTTTLKMQTSWPATDIFTEMANQYITRVNDMAGGRLKIDLLHGGAVVHPFQVFDGVSGGQIDAAHTVTVYWYGKHKAASLFGTGPVFGFNANEGLGWIHYGGGKELFDELQTQIMKVNIKSFFAMPMPTQPLGWFKKPVTKAEDMKGLKYRTVGLAADLMQAMGLAVAQLPGGEIVPAMERGVIDAFEFNNPTSDRRFGAHNVAKNYLLGSHHQATEYFEIMFNRTKFNALAEGAAGDPAILRRGGVLRQRMAGDAAVLGRPAGPDQQGEGQRGAHAARRVRRADQGLGRADPDARRRSLHEEGDGLAEGVGAQGRVLQHDERHRLQGRVQPSLPGRPEDLARKARLRDGLSGANREGRRANAPPGRARGDVMGPRSLAVGS